MKKIVALLSLLVFLSGIVVAQKSFPLTGKITDKQGNAIASATVSILNTNWSEISDGNGAFTFKALPAGKYQVLVSSIGYASTNTEVLLNTSSQPVSISLPRAESSFDAVIVTAQKREEALQKIPVSVTALGASQVREYRLWNNNEISAIVPNLYSSNSGDDRNVTSIRGIVTTSYDPAVATYVDGVNQFGLDTYIPNLIDVERIEVLRGPQGTLYGRNAMGGVINIITRQPTNSTNSFAEINIGNKGQQRYSAGFRSPIIQNKLFLSVAAVYHQRDGFYTNEYNNSTYDDQKVFTGNYSLKFVPVANWSVTANFKHHINRNFGAYPLVFGVQEAFDNPFKLSQNALAKMIDNTVNGSLSVNHTGRFFNFSSQTAYQSNHRYYNAPLDGDFSPIDGVTIINDYGKDWNNVKVFTQEFKLTSPAYSSSPLKWTAGAYFFHQDNPTKLTTRFGEDAELVGAPDKNFSVTNTNTGKSTGIAVYGQINYELTPKLSLIAGVRMDYEKKKFTVMGEYQKDPDPAFVTQPDTTAEVDYSAVSPRLGLSYEINKNHLLYATYSRGFRSGGLTQLSTDPSQPPLFSYKPEYGNNIEAGIKNSLLENSIHLNVVLFYTRVNDVQVPTLVLPDAITITRNAGKLRSMGAELELDVPVGSLFKIDYHVGFTDAKYTSLKVSQGGAEVNLEGKKQIFTPSYTSMLALQYAQPLGRKKAVRAIARAEMMNFGKQYFDLNNSIEQKAYGLLNLRGGVSMKHLDIFVWSRNTTDKKYISYAYDFGAVHLGNPLTWGVTVSARL